MDALTRTLEKRGAYARQHELTSQFMDLASRRRP
jgi:hypothetical protein